MGKRHLLFLLAAGAVLRAAETEAPKAKADASATVTVTAEATPVELKKTPNPVRVLDAEAIRRSGARTLAELLERELPGQVSQGGGTGTAASPQLNGMRPQDAVVLLDGVRLTDASGLGVNLSDVALAGVVRVEVQRGPASVLYGSDAQGGVIALYTDSSVPKGYEGDWMLGVGTHGLGRLSLKDVYGWEGGALRFHFTGSREDAPTDADNRFRQASTYLGFSQQVAEDHIVGFTYRNTFQGVPIPYASAGLTFRAYDAARQDFGRTEQFVLNWRAAWGPSLSSELSLGRASQERHEPQYAGSGYDPYTSKRDQIDLALHWAPATAFGGSLLLQGIQEFARTPAYPTGIDKAAGRHLAAALELRWEPLDTLRLVGGVRHQKDRQDYESPTAPSPDTRNDQTTAKLGVNWLLPAGLRAYASGGSAFSNPLLFQVLYNTQNGGAPLTNEKSHFVQAGLGWERGPWHARLEAQRTKLDEAVLFDLSTYLYMNASRLRSQGLEGALGYRAESWGLEAFLRSQEVRDLNLPQDQQLQGGSVLRRPFTTAGLRGDLEIGAFRGDLAYSWQGPRYEYFGYDAAFNPVYGPSRVHFNDLNAAVTWAGTERFSLTLRGEHLLTRRTTREAWLAGETDFRNDAYQVFNFPAQPPTVSLELRYRY